MISLLVPSRGRPTDLMELMASAFTMASKPLEIELCIYLDNDDPSYDCLQFLNREARNLVIYRGERQLLSNCWNKLYTIATGPYYMHCGDDIRFRTYGWDAMVLHSFSQYPDPFVFVHGNDLIQQFRIGTHGFLHEAWVQALGYFVPPYFSSDYNDLWLTEIADAVNRRCYLPDLITEHLHFSVGKHELDQTHKERLERHENDLMDQVYRNRASQRKRDAERLRLCLSD